MRGVFHLDISSIYLFIVSRVLFYVFWVFTAEEFGRVGYNGSGDTTVVNLQALQEVLWKYFWVLPISLIRLKKKPNFWSRDYFLQVVDYQYFKIIGYYQIKGILLYISIHCKQCACKNLLLVLLIVSPVATEERG